MSWDGADYANAVLEINTWARDEESGKPDDRIRRMGDEKLSLSELKKRGQSLGYTKIQRLYTSAKAPLETWDGFATESDVYYVLSENQVTVFKNGKPEAHYLLS